MDAVKFAEGLKHRLICERGHRASKKHPHGRIVLPEDHAYEEGRRVWNGTVDKRPAAIIYCTSSHDVVKAVELCAVRNLARRRSDGGHNVAGSSMCDGGVVIDLSRMKRIEMDPVRGIA